MVVEKGNPLGLREAIVLRASQLIEHLSFQVADEVVIHDAVFINSSMRRLYGQTFVDAMRAQEAGDMLVRIEMGLCTACPGEPKKAQKGLKVCRGCKKAADREVAEMLAHPVRPLKQKKK